MRTLLLADDSVTIQRVIELTFSGEDIRVIAVGDGEQAIARIPEERPDVVIADIGMPRKGGYDVAAFVKGRPDLARIPVLLLAGAFEKYDQAQADAVGAEGVVIKPFEPRQLVERVKDLLTARPVAQGTTAVTPAVVDGPAGPPVPPPTASPATPAKLLALPSDPAPAPVPAAASPIEEFSSLEELFESINRALTQPSPPADTATPESSRAQTGPSAGAVTSTGIESTGFEPSAAQPNVPDAAQPMPRSEDTPAPSAHVGAAGSPAPAANNTLDEYFDRLSAAFANTRPASSAPSPSAEATGETRVESRTTAPATHEWLAFGEESEQLFLDRPLERGINPVADAVWSLAEESLAESASTAAPAASGASGIATPVGPDDATVNAITERVVERLLPELTESLRRIVRQEIERRR